MRRLLDDWTDLKRGDSVEVLQLSSPPPKGRVRSKSTHNDRSVMLSKFDKDWENYDHEPGDEVSDDAMDGGTTVRKLSKRRPSSKRVKIFEEPTVIGEDEEKKNESNTEQMIPRTSKKNILKNRPLLKRQSAEEDEDSLHEEKNVRDNLDGSRQGGIEKHHAFDRQRFNHVRKRETSKTSKSLKRGRWRRDNSYKYRKKMQHQVSFNEDEEEEDEEEKEDEMKNDGRQEVEESKGGPLWMKCKDSDVDKDQRELDRIDPEPCEDGVATNVMKEENAQSSYFVENMVQNMGRFESKGYSRVLEHPAGKGSGSDDENDNVRGSNDESLKKGKLVNTKSDGSLLKEDTSQESEHSHFEVDLDVHRLIVLKPNQLQSSLHNGKKLVSPSASSDAPLIEESDSAIEYSTCVDNVVIALSGSEADTKKVQIGNGVSQRENECIEVSMILGSESLERS